MIVVLLGQKGGVDKTTLAPHPAGQWGRQGKRVTRIDAGPQGSALDWSEQRARRRFDRLFGVIGLARDALHREAPELARHADHIGIDGPPRVAALPRSALLAADLWLISAGRSPFDGWASAEMLALIAEARVVCSAVTVRFVLNHCPARTNIVRKMGRSLAEHDPPAVAAPIGRRVIFVDVPCAGQLVVEQDDHGPAARNRSAGSRDRKARAMTARDRHGGFAARPRDAESRIEKPDPGSSNDSTGTIHTAQRAVDITPSLFGRSKIAALRRGVSVSGRMRDLPAREFTVADGDRL